MAVTWLESSMIGARWGHGNMWGVCHDHVWGTETSSGMRCREQTHVKRTKRGNLQMVVKDEDVFFFPFVEGGHCTCTKNLQQPKKARQRSIMSWSYYGWRSTFKQTCVHTCRRAYTNTDLRTYKHTLFFLQNKDCDRTSCTLPIQSFHWSHMHWD